MIVHEVLPSKSITVHVCIFNNSEVTFSLFCRYFLLCARYFQWCNDALFPLDLRETMWWANIENKAAPLFTAVKHLLCERFEGKRSSQWDEDLSWASRAWDNTVAKMNDWLTTARDEPRGVMIFIHCWHTHSCFLRSFCQQKVLMVSEDWLNSSGSLADWRIRVGLF